MMHHVAPQHLQWEGCSLCNTTWDVLQASTTAHSTVWFIHGRSQIGFSKQTWWNLQTHIDEGQWPLGTNLHELTAQHVQHIPENDAYWDQVRFHLTTTHRTVLTSPSILHSSTRRLMCFRLFHPTTVRFSELQSTMASLLIHLSSSRVSGCARKHYHFDSGCDFTAVQPSFRSHFPFPANRGIRQFVCEFPH